MIPLEEILSSFKLFKLPMRTRFRGVEEREVAIIEGPQGYGEFSPFLEYSPEESANWLLSAIAGAYEDRPPLLRSEIAVNGTIPALDSAAEIDEVLSWYPDFKVFKIKIGRGLTQDITRIKRVMNAIPGVKIRLDVNGTWGVDEAIFNIRTLYGDVLGDSLEYVEQPVGSLDQLKELKSRLLVDVKIAGDEVLRKAADPFALDLSEAIDILMLKVAPLGGISRAIKLAQHHKLPVVLSSALDSVVGINYGLELAGSIPELAYASGFATGAFFTHDLGKIPMESGFMRVNSVQYDSAALEDFLIEDERLEWWRNRISESWKAAQ